MQDPQAIDDLRTTYQGILALHKYPKIEEKVLRFLKKLASAESIGRLRQLMNNLVKEGLVQGDRSRGRTFYKKNRLLKLILE